MIIQENRTPDNLFGAGPPHPICGIPDGFEPGVDIQNGGPDASGGQTQTRCLLSQRLATCWDIDHKNATWNHQADIQDGTNVAKMDMACTNPVYAETPGCSPALNCPQFSFVQKSDVQPYFDIATNYGFANYMFATNQGPSFPAHLFLLSGTSAPSAPGDPNYLDFVAENAGFAAGCPFNGGSNYPGWVNPAAQPLLGTIPCYDHPTLVDQLDGHNPAISWRYYAPKPGIIWTAVDAIKHLCYANPNQNPGVPCNSTDWGHMSFEGSANPVPVLTDILNCQLQQVSWVIPDERWSDHPGYMGGPSAIGAGPSYVANIINAIGNSGCTDNINNTYYTYWQDTAIFILWDDWGGWFDHVTPPKILRTNDGQNDCGAGQWGCGYTYGFRVPLLVVSAYTKAGYVSGALPSPGKVAPYIHDFGSILAFIENNFVLNYIAPSPYYADRNAPDNVPPSLPLADFFQWPYRGFVPISPAVGMDTNYFFNYFVSNPTEGPVGPDGDDAD